MTASLSAALSIWSPACPLDGMVDIRDLKQSSSRCGDLPHSVEMRTGIGARSTEEPVPSHPHDALKHDEGELERTADVAKSVDAADFNWSARGEIRGAEPLKVGES